MKSHIILSNTEYQQLYLYGSDKDAAVFCHLRAFKDGKRRYSASKHPIRQLSSITGISYNVLKRSVDLLSHLNLLRINSDGGITINSTKRSNRLFKGIVKTEKIIKIKIHSSFLQTATEIAFVRVNNNLLLQKKRINKKLKQKEQLNVYNWHKNHPEKYVSLKQYKAGEALMSKLKSLQAFSETICEKTILSYKGFSKLVNKQNVHNGKYFKTKLLSLNKIRSERRYEKYVL